MKKSELPGIGQPLNGGFFAGLLSTTAGMIAIIVSPKAEGTANDKPWGKYGEKIIGANSFNDGKNNTVNMAVAGSETALWAQSLNINGFDDWYIPSRDELETIYRNLKPTTNDNYVYRHGENPSAIELSDRFPYTENLPAQTTAALFQKDGSESLDPVWHWSSTQSSADADGHKDFYLPAPRELSLLYANVPEHFDPKWHWSSQQYSADGAWLQHFEDGYQLIDLKSIELAVRAVRRVYPLSHSAI